MAGKNTTTGATNKVQNLEWIFQGVLTTCPAMSNSGQFRIMQPWRQTMSATLLKGRKLSSAISSAAKKFGTFTEFVHNVAYSALMHVETSQDPCHLNRFIETIPSESYRQQVINYAKAFGKVSWDKEAKAFKYAKSRKSDMEAARTTAPADLTKAESQSTGAKPFANDEAAIAFLEKTMDTLKSRKASRAIQGAMRLALQTAKGNNLAAPAAKATRKTKATPKSNVTPINRPAPTPEQPVPVAA